ncbi:MAG: sensor histidine kinase, partial [Cyanobacteria bacterium J083]
MSSIQLATETMKNLINNASEIQKSPTFHRVFTIFNQSCKRQKQLVEDLLTLCYLDAKAETITLEWIDLNCWLPDLTQLFLRRAEEQQQELILDLFADKLMILTDPMILERIVQELLNNACKYTPKNATITLQTKATDKEIVLSVSNTGVEIPAAEQALIFNQFYRIPNNDPWQYGGTGLGLTLVKKLTEILNASISVASENQTTVFSLKFPKS